MKLKENIQKCQQLSPRFCWSKTNLPDSYNPPSLLCREVTLTDRHQSVWRGRRSNTDGSVKYECTHFDETWLLGLLPETCSGSYLGRPETHSSSSSSSPPLSRWREGGGGLRGTAYVLTILLQPSLPSASLRVLARSSSVHSLMLSSQRFFDLPRLIPPGSVPYTINPLGSRMWNPLFFLKTR